MQAPAPTTPPTSALTPEPRRGPLYALFAANVVSSIGDNLAFIAVPWFVLQTTGSVEQTGITAACTTAGVAVSAFFGASLVDLLGYRRASILSDLASGLAIAGIPLLYLLGQLAFRELLALVFLAGLFTTPGATARSSLIPDLAALGRVRLERAAAASDGVQRVSIFVGALLAGVLIIAVGTSSLLWIDAATFLVSATVIVLAVPRRLPIAPAIAGAATQPGIPPAALPSRRGPFKRLRRYVADLSQGVRFIWRDGVVFGIIAAVLVTNLLDEGFVSVLAPAYVRQVFGDPVVLGSIFALFGAGAFLGTILFGLIGHRLPRRWTLGISFTLGGGTRFLALAIFPILPVQLAVEGGAGLCLGQINPLTRTLEYERVPAALRARVFGTITAGVMLGAPLGGLLSGLCAAAIGAQATLLVFGAIYLLATLSLLVNPALKGMGRRTALNGSHELDGHGDI
jgi:MFS family permease